MALSSFIANCFKYLWVSKMKPIQYVFLKLFMKILSLLTIIDKKHPLYVFILFETSKSWNCWPFYPTGSLSRIHTFEKRQCYRCRHRSAVKNTPPPPFHSQSPSLPPTVPTTPAPTAQGQWYLAFWILWPPRPMACRPWRTAYVAVPFHSTPLPPSCPVPAKLALPVEKKVSHSRKGQVKNTWHGAKRQWEKQALKQRGDM